jgi:hypothetical protein
MYSCHFQMPWWVRRVGSPLRKKETVEDAPQLTEAPVGLEFREMCIQGWTKPEAPNPYHFVAGLRHGACRFPLVQALSGPVSTGKPACGHLCGCWAHASLVLVWLLGLSLGGEKQEEGLHKGKLAGGPHFHQLLIPAREDQGAVQAPYFPRRYCNLSSTSFPRRKCQLQQQDPRCHPLCQLMSTCKDNEGEQSLKPSFLRPLSCHTGPQLAIPDPPYRKFPQRAPSLVL